MQSTIMEDHGSQINSKLLICSRAKYNFIADKDKQRVSIT